MRSVHLRRAAAAAAAALAVGATGCVSWRVETVSPRELLRGKDVPAVRVSRPDRSKVELYDPQLAGDSIVGHPTDRAIARVAIPLAQIQTIETRHHSLGKSLLAGLAIGGGVVLYELLQSLNQGSGY
jgi:hypothetical protein